MNTDIVELVHRARWFPVIEHSIHKWVNSNDTCGLGKIRVYAQPNTDLVVSTCSNNPLLTDTASRERLKLKIAEIEGKLDIQDSIESKLARLDQRIDAADAQAKQQQEKSQEKEISRERSIEQGFGIGH